MDLTLVKRCRVAGGLGWMLCRRNIRWRGGAVLAGVVAVLVGLGMPVAAQQTGDAQTPGNAPQIGWADGEAGFEWVSKWVRDEAGVPGDAALPGGAVTSLFGVCVTLREDGRVLGRGVAYREDVAQAIDVPGPPIRLAPLLAKATRDALDDLRDKLMKRAVELKINDPQLFSQAFLDTRNRVQVDLQLGHSLTSIVLPLDANDDAAFTQYAPGYHGLRLTGPIAAVPSYAWPATELSRNTSPPRTVFNLLRDQGYDAQDLPLIARGDGPRLHRFDILHFVQPSPSQPIHNLTRGGLVLNQQAIDARSIPGLAENTARYIERLMVTNPTTLQSTVRGTYQPSADRFGPAKADAREAALMSYVLTRQAKVAIQADLVPKVMQRRADRALELTMQLQPIAIPNNAPPRHLTAAFMLLTLCETPTKLLPDQLVLRDRLGRMLVDLRHPEGGGYRAAPNSDTRLSRESAAVVTAALAAWHNATRSKTLAKPIWSVLDQLIQANANTPRPNDLFWITFALDRSGQALANAQADPQAAQQTLADWHAAIAAFLDTISDRQIRARPALGPRDVLGGFVFEDTLPGTPPNPTWQSAVPVATLALCLRNPAIIPSDRNFGPLLSASLGARFLVQLTVNPTNGYYLRNPETAIGGVRTALWDNTLTPDASAMTLLALAELQHTLNQLEN